jgi:hypothetical protein
MILLICAFGESVILVLMIWLDIRVGKLEAKMRLSAAPPTQRPQPLFLGNYIDDSRNP